jgi:hypothetical protein
MISWFAVDAMPHLLAGLKDGRHLVCRRTAWSMPLAARFETTSQRMCAAAEKKQHALCCAPAAIWEPMRCRWAHSVRSEIPV